MVVLDKPTYERLFKEVPTYKLISQSVLVDRLRLNGSLARVAIRELEAQGLIKPVLRHHAQVIYSKFFFFFFIFGNIYKFYVSIQFKYSISFFYYCLNYIARATGDEKKQAAAAGSDEE